MLTRIITLTLIILWSSNVVNAQFRTKKTIGDHAILQRDVEIPITGWGAPNEKVKIIFGKKEFPTTADSDGMWSTKIPATPAGGPHKIEIKSANNGLIYKDIYFGDVWLCSGQSNMEWILQKTDQAEEEIAAANDGMIRHFKVPHLNEQEPIMELPDIKWEVLSPETAGNFTAVGYYFAKNIRETNDVPIGLLNSSWGGSRIEPWMNKETLDSSHPDYSYQAYATKHNLNYQGKKASLQKRFPGLTSKDQGMENGKPLWVMDEASDKWEKIDPLRLWEEQKFESVDGVAYYRTYFEAQSEITLKLGAIDDNDMVWVNGQLVGETKGYDKERIYKVASNLLKEGKNELLIRIVDTGGGGGMYKTEFKTGIADRPLSEFTWEIRLGSLEITTLSNHVPNLIYNAMIHPILDFPIKGVIWYQGESNTGSVQDAFDYRFLLRSLIGQWRMEWKNPELPFYIVQLANFRAPKNMPSNDAWAVIRESMTSVLELPNTGQAVIIDIGEENDIHPRNKRDVGYRLALPARNQIYGEDVVPGSPMYASHEVVGNHIVINFKQVGDGLMVNDKYGYVNGFSIIDEDGTQLWAQAKLEKGKVVVWNEKIMNPISVRYAWETNPGDVNLFSKSGLPVTPFRTDRE